MCIYGWTIQPITETLLYLYVDNTFNSLTTCVFMGGQYCLLHKHLCLYMWRIQTKAGPCMSLYLDYPNYSRTTFVVMGGQYSLLQNTCAFYVHKTVHTGNICNLDTIKNHLCILGWTIQPITKPVVFLYVTAQTGNICNLDTIKEPLVYFGVDNTAYCRNTCEFMCGQYSL